MRKVSVLLLSFCFLSCAEEEFADDFYEIPKSFDPKPNKTSNLTTDFISEDENEGQSHEEFVANATKLSSFSSEIDLNGMANESMAQIYKQLLIDHERNDTIINSNDKSSEKTNYKSIKTTANIKSFSTSESITSETTETIEKTGNNTEVMMTLTTESEEELNKTSSTTESKQSLIASNETIEKIENMTTTATTILKSTLSLKYSKLLDDSNDDITLPPDFENGMTTTARTRTLQTITPKRQLFAPQFQSPALPPPPPMYPIMPPNIPVNPGYQTIWIPIQVPRDPYSIDQMWKKSRTPTFIERGRLKNRLSIREGTPESWWRRPQPNFCTEPIFVNDYCKDRTPVKRWAFNQADERCYRYVDYCFADKHNSFDTLQKCLTSCWRATI
jgi:hypothetical protein